MSACSTRFVSSGTPGASQNRVSRSHWLRMKVTGSHSGEFGSTLRLTTFSSHIFFSCSIRGFECCRW